jgi:hypothetical protein
LQRCSLKFFTQTSMDPMTSLSTTESPDDSDHPHGFCIILYRPRWTKEQMSCRGWETHSRHSHVGIHFSSAGGTGPI